jgi:predicted RNA binding protein YcfA (HicA-like mRNA interferase family)
MRLRKLYEAARTSPNNMSFRELRTLVEAAGYEFRRQKGSHLFFVHPEFRDVINIQGRRGKAKPYQVKQVLRRIEENGILE